MADMGALIVVSYLGPSEGSTGKPGSGSAPKAPLSKAALTSAEKQAKKRARWGSGGYQKRAEHDECPHPVKGSHDPAVEQCCMCGKQTAVKPA